METPTKEPEEEWSKEFIEKGADIEHDRWARWQKYMFSKGTVDENGVFHLPKEFVDRWFRQIDTKYADLSEPEKESDRKETRNYLPLVAQAKSQGAREALECLEKALPQKYNDDADSDARKAETPRVAEMLGRQAGKNQVIDWVSKYIYEQKKL